MATRKRTTTSRSTAQKATGRRRTVTPGRAREGDVLRYCASVPPVQRQLPTGLTVEHTRAILVGASKWLNGTVLHYSFFGRATARP